MIVYSEEKQNHQSVYMKKIISEDGELLSEKRVNCPVYFIEKDNFVYILLYSDDMKPIHDAFVFLNYNLRNYPITTRRNAAAALRFLYCFLSLTDYDIRKLDQSRLDQLNIFLQGSNTEDKKHRKYELQTIRSEETLSSYFAVYKRYFKARNIICEALFTSHRTLKSGHKDGSIRGKKAKDKSGAGARTNEIPNYISPEEFQKLYRNAFNKNDRMAQIIMHLLYGYGLRLGEVLGLTLEDLVKETQEGQITPALILRNRVSDQSFQYAKNLMHVSSREEYKTDSDYKRSYSTIHITQNLYDEMESYIKEQHGLMMKKYPDHYEEGMADSVDASGGTERNHYIFLNRYGRVLSAQTWNNSLKDYFKEAGILIDYKVKKDNLSHRLRHGFAMFHAHYSEKTVDAPMLKDMLRHKTIASTMIYYSTAEDDKLQMDRKALEELYTLVPELKR